MSEVSAIVYLDRISIGHAWFGGIGDGIGSISITRDAWRELGESTEISVSLSPHVDNSDD